MTSIQPVKSRDVLLYTISRYAGLIVLLLRGVLIAKYLGPTLFGIWGFVTLLQQYLAYTNLGIQHAATVELSNKNINDPTWQSRLMANALGLTIILAAILILAGMIIHISNISIFAKYDFSHYAFLTLLIAALSHITTLFVSTYRIYGLIYRIAAFQFIDAILPLAALWFLPTPVLLPALLGTMVVSQIIGIILFLIRPPYRISFQFQRASVLHVIFIALPLLAYNASFNLITAIARTVLSTYYPVEIMGYYSLANSLTNAVLLGLRSIVFVLLPEVIHNTRPDLPDEIAGKAAYDVNVLYGISAFLLAYLLIIILPLLFYIIPDYQPAQNTVAILLLVQAVLSLSFGYNAAALSRGYQLTVAKLSCLALAIVGMLSLAIAYFQFEFYWIAVAVLIGSLIFTILQNRLGRRILGLPFDIQNLLQDRLVTGGIISIGVFIFVIQSKISPMAGVTAFTTFVGFNVQNLSKLFITAQRLFNKR
ncbi:MAG: hypothetical protein R3A44_29400 [Caldilineaceae bacterium]